MAMQGGGWGGGPGGPPIGGSPPQGQAMQPAPAQFPPRDGIVRTACQACGRRAPVKQVTLMQNIGLLIIRFPKKVHGWLCKRCISKHFWEMTTITFFLGWWGIISFFYSLVSIPTNIATYLGARSLPDE